MAVSPDTRVTELHLPQEMAQICRVLGVETVGDLLLVGPEDLQSLPEVRPATVRQWGDIRSAVATDLISGPARSDEGEAPFHLRQWLSRRSHGLDSEFMRACELLDVYTVGELLMMEPGRIVAGIEDAHVASATKDPWAGTKWEGRARAHGPLAGRVVRLQEDLRRSFLAMLRREASGRAGEDAARPLPPIRHGTLGSPVDAGQRPTALQQRIAGAIDRLLGECPGAERGPTRNQPVEGGAPAGSVEGAPPGRTPGPSHGELPPDASRLLDAALRELSGRAFSAVVRAGARDLEGFLALSEDRLRATPGAGAKTVAEIIAQQEALRRRVGAHQQSTESTTLAAFGERGDDRGGTPRRAETQPTGAARHTLVAERRTPPPSWTPPVVRGRHSSRPAWSLGAGEPLDWSVLRRALSAVDAPFSREDVGSETAGRLPHSTPASGGDLLSGLAFSERAWRRLEAAAIFTFDPLECLQWFSAGYWLSIGVDDAALATLLDAARALASGAALPASQEPIIGGTRADVLRGLTVESDEVPDCLRRTFRASELYMWTDVAGLSERDVLERFGLSPTALRLIDALWGARAWLEVLRQRLPQDLPEGAYDDPLALVRSFVGLAASSSRDAVALEGRLGLLEGRRWTLAELGERLGITRERVRQIEIGRTEGLRGDARRLWRLWWAVDGALQRSGGACLMPELAGEIARAFEWDEPPDTGTLAALLSFCDSVSVRNRDGDDLCLDPFHPCPSCSAARRVLREVVDAAGGSLAVSAARQALQEHCEAHCADNRAPWARVGGGLVHHLVSGEPDLTLESGTICSGEQRALRFGRRGEAIDAVLRRHPRAMHVSEVYRELCGHRPADAVLSPRTVHAGLSRSEHLLWGRGMFIHRTHVAVPEQLMRKAADWLATKLESGVPFYSVHGAFARYQGACEEAQVPNVYALYSCLRECGDTRLTFPRFPYVLPAAETERVPFVVAMQQYVANAGGPVDAKEMLAYGTSELGMPEQLVSMHIPGIPGILRVGQRCYLHTDYLVLSREDMEPLVAASRELLGSGMHVSVAKLFREKQVTCHDLHITNPVMLYSVLRYFAPDDLEFPRYPQMRAPTPDGQWSQHTIADEVLAYILAKGGPCGAEELEEQFVDQRGYRLETVYSALEYPQVARYSRSSYIHLGAVSWGEAAQGALHGCAQRRYDRRRAAGFVYARLTDLLEDRDLPALPAGIPWTQRLLGSLLPRQGRFVILGNRRDAYVATPNEEKIATLPDLLAVLLRDRYDGACSLDEFAQALRDGGIIQREFTPSMIGDGERVRIVGATILLSDLVLHA